jgi:hypothetical protein
MGKLVLQCPYGNMTEIVPNGLGLNPQASKTRDACLMNETLYHNHQCDPVLNHVALQKAFNTDCANKSSCVIEVFNKTYDSRYINDRTLSKVDAKTDSQCRNTRAQIFIQYKCEISDIEKGSKYDKLSFVTISVLFACFIFAMMVHYLTETSRMDELKYDVNTITAADFTIEMEITDKMY